MQYPYIARCPITRDTQVIRLKYGIEWSDDYVTNLWVLNV
jgi:hypothetical protein